MYKEKPLEKKTNLRDKRLIPAKKKKGPSPSKRPQSTGKERRSSKGEVLA